jgi:hypothetical protein
VVVDAVLLAALDANLIACREVAKHFECPYGTGASITPDGVIVMADGRSGYDTLHRTLGCTSPGVRTWQKQCTGR